MRTLFQILCLSLLTASLHAQAPATPKSSGKARSPGKSASAAKSSPIQPQPASRPNALLKINVTAQPYSLHMPWQKESPTNSRGLGVVLEGNRVLVTAQMVADATYIEMEQPDSGQKIPAKVLAVDYEANLALIESAVPAERAKTFFAGLRPMSIDTSSRVGDAVSVWQTGRVGDLIETPLSVSKVLIRRYIVEGSSFLVYEATGIIRSEANSFTLPVIKGNKLAGLLLSYDSKNQVTTILPAPIIEHFLKDFADGAYEGFPGLGMEYQVTLDEQLRDYLGLKPDGPGVLITGVIKNASAEKAGLKKGDILLAINGHAIDARGDYRDATYGALNASHIVRGGGYVGDKFELKVIRDGKEELLTGTLARKNPEAYLVTPYSFDKGPRYILMGGLLFQELSRPYLESFGEQQSENASLLRLAHIAAHPDEIEAGGRKKLVFLSMVLPTPSAQGYDQLGGIVVNKVNGHAIGDLGDLDAAFKDVKGTAHVVELDDFPHLLHLDAIAAERDNLRLQGGAYRIPSLKRLE
ncbi:MAG: PDZ domain-containing protein [Verrucomicrobiaceae bacterium]|nr:PDZ domain-containing protein [Verrucomicrobiaceae bacterium]